MLAVDDNNTNREILQAQLASWSLRAEVASGATQALAMLREAAASGQPFRFAVLDMHMPEIDGLELARSIKAGPATRDVILISLSSIGEHIKPADRGEMGFAVCLSKPALPSQLYNALVDSLAATETNNLGPLHAIPQAPAPHAPLAGVRVLLAEDNEINRYVASEMLQQCGCTVTMAVNGREAVAAAMGSEFDVILMDCQMPELDGFGASREIRELERTASSSRHRPIIALTANAIKGDRELCLAAGMDDYVTKPIDPPSLLAAIRSLVGASRPTGVTAEAPLNPTEPRGENRWPLKPRR